MPEKFFGKKVEVIVVELTESAKDINPIPPIGKKIAVDELFENFGSAPDFPSGGQSEPKRGRLSNCLK